MTDASLLRRYLLGDLDESEMEAIEKRLMVSGEELEELTIEEDELIDDYWAGKLDESELVRYRTHFLTTPDRKRRHRLGAAFREHVSRMASAARDTSVSAVPGPVPGSFVRTWLPLAAAAMVVIVLGSTTVWKLTHSPVRLQQSSRVDESSSVAFFLTAGNLRSLPTGEARVITVSADVEIVQLQLDLGDGPAGEREVVLEDASDDAVLAEGTLAPEVIEGQTVVVAPVPADLLTPGEYRVILRRPSKEAERAEERAYAFRVARP